MAMVAIPVVLVVTSAAALISPAHPKYGVVSSHRPVPAHCLTRSVLRDEFIGQGRRYLVEVAGGFGQSSRYGIRGGDSRKKKQQVWKVMAGSNETELTEQKWGPPVSLGTAELPQDVDFNKLQSLLYMWGNSLTQNANLPLPVPLKVDKVEGGVRLGYIKVTNGKIEDLVHIDVLVTPPSKGEPKAMFRAVRNGQLKNTVPPGEPLIMQSLLAALKQSLSLSRTSS